MATYTSNFLSGAQSSNVFTPALLSTLLRSAPDDASLIQNIGMVYTFSASDSFSFTASGGFSAAWTGTVTGFTAIVSEAIVTTGAGFSVSGTAVRDAIAEGDTDALNALFWSGNDQMTGRDSDDTLRGFAGRDTLLGGAGDDTLSGDAGNDRIVGGAGDDIVFGGTGNDRVFGGAGNDVIVGGAGRDVIGGGEGSDIVTGGTGADTFEFRSTYQLIGTGTDRITDFSKAEGDKIDLSFIDANTVTNGDGAFTWFDNTQPIVVQPFPDLTEPDVVGPVSGPGGPAAGSLIVTLGWEPDTYVVSLYVDFSGDSLSFLVHSVGGLPTADDFIL
jgi:Ca2+-binding RTX toxin-like protein